MEGVPEQFCYEQDRASFRHLPGVQGVELYRAHITHYAFEPHTHEAFGIGTIDIGAERFRYRGEQHLAPVDSLVLMNPDELHTGESASEGGWQYRMIYLEPQRLAELTGESGWWFDRAVRHHPQHAREVSQILSRLWQTDDALAIDGLLLSLCDVLRPHARNVCPSETSARHRFDRVRDYLRDNLAERITLGDLSALMSLSPYHFQRQFKAQYHVTPHQMLMAFRLYHARQLLIDGMPSAEVAAAVGLTDQAHLTRSFAARYGITPARYQKQVRQSG
ncbi:AraC family transcriptional regulator [Erwinia sp. S38]|uniref:AraC family transcriptional regulator n=1 Tax=Erwinia sp. S38 TaxID=2769338 RepID=UPI00190D392C|nr:AraC family transcriptional regulator [Erwinia sp. S38]